MNAVSGSLVRALATVLVGLEAAALTISSVAFAWHGITGTPDAALTWALVVMLLVLAVPLGAAARSIGRGRRWGRSYGLMWQVLQVAAGWYLLELSLAGGIAVIAAAVMAGAAVVLDTRADPQI